MTKASKEGRGSATGILAELGLYSPAGSGIYVIYGEPATGKTTLVARLLEEASREGAPAVYIATEPNVRLYGQWQKIRSLLPARAKCNGVEIDAVQYHDSYTTLMYAALKALQCKNLVMAVDSVTALALHEQARRMAETGRLEILPIIREVSAFANAFAQLIASRLASEEGRQAQVYLVAQARAAIGQPWHGEPLAPSFALRAQHNVGACARLVALPNGERLLKVVWHRDARYAGKAAKIRLEPL